MVLSFDPSVGADNTFSKPTSRSDLCARPKNCVFQCDTRFDSTMGADRPKTGETDTGIDYSVWRDQDRPFCVAEIVWFPSLLLDKAMNLKIFHSGTDIEPLTVVNNHPADFAALPNPFSDDRYKRQ